MERAAFRQKINSMMVNHFKGLEGVLNSQYQHKT